MNNINISKDLEKSVVPDSVIITDINNKPYYLTPPNYPEMYLGKDIDGKIKYKTITFPQVQVNNDLGYFGSTIQQGFPLVKNTSTNLSGFRRDFFGNGIFSIGLNQDTPQFGLYDGLFYSPSLKYFGNKFQIQDYGKTTGEQQKETLIFNTGSDNTTTTTNSYNTAIVGQHNIGSSNIMTGTQRLFAVDNGYYGGGIGTGLKSSVTNVQTSLFRFLVNTGANIDFDTVHNIRSQIYRRAGGSTINTLYHINTEEVDTAVPITNYFGLHILAGDKNYIKNNLGINTTTPVRKLEITETAGTPPIRTTNMTSSSTDMTGVLKTVVVDANGDFGVKTSSNNDFWRNTDGVTLPDGTNDYKEQIKHSADIFVGGNAGNVRVGNGNGNIFSNTVIGEGCLYSNTTGIANVASGYQSLYSNTTGNVNVANGYQTLYSNTTGGYNIAIGNSSLYSNTTGGYNIAIGNRSLYYNTTGGYNVANGFSSLYYNTTGGYNIAIGNRSLFYNTTGSVNVAIGNRSLYYNTTGGYNIANGFNSLYYNTTGNYNIFCGYQAGFNNFNVDNNIGIGTHSLFLNTKGLYNIGLGYNSLYYNQESSNTALGYNSFNKYKVLATSATITALSTTQFNISPALTNFSIGEYVTILSISGYLNNLSGFLLEKTYKIINSTTLEVIDPVNQVLGTTGTVTGIEVRGSLGYTNSTVVGYNSQPTKSNQVAFGDTNVTSALFSDKVELDLTSIGALTSGSYKVNVTKSGSTSVLSLSTFNSVSKFYVQQALTVGSNTITHNLNLTTPKAIHLEIRNDADGTLQIVPITGYTANSITLNVTTAITLANIIIIG